MPRGKNFLFYIFLITLFVGLITFVINYGNDLEKNKKKIQLSISDTASENISLQNTISNYLDEVSLNMAQPIGVLILQIISIMLAARIFGYLFFKMGQPLVIGEIIAGIFLGPSFLGMWFPEVTNFLFPEASIKFISLLSKIGLMLFMFIVGVELDLQLLKAKKHTTVIISHVSIIFPYFLGVILSYFIYDSLAPANTSFVSFALFIGIAMSITAFPVLARIIRDRNLSKTSLGAMSLTCAAADDVTAWCILACVIGIAKAGNIINALFTLFFAMAYILGMIYIVKPWLAELAQKHIQKDSLNKKVLSFIFTLLLCSSLLSEAIGIHLLFGAFIAGVVIPDKASLKHQLIQKIEDVSLVLLLPLFFIFTGLRTQIGLLNDGKLWLICAVIILLAVVGKFVSCALSAKFLGQSWKDSLSLGVLMNTRGLMELIVLNIGYDLGILSKEIFAMMVIMALVTTFMAGPALNLINYISSKKTKPDSEDSINPEDLRTQAY